MVQYILWFMVITMISTISDAKDFLKTPELGKVSTIFAHTNHEDAYWQALLHAANGRKQEAQTLSDALQSGADLSALPLPWKTGAISNIETLFDKLFIDYVSLKPETLSKMGLLESVGIAEHNTQFDDVSIEAHRYRLARNKENALLLQQFPYHELSPEHKTSYEIFAWQLNHDIADEPFLLHEYRQSQMYGPIQYIVYVLTQFHRLESVRDVKLYVSRLSQGAHKLDQSIAFMMLQEKNGITPPRSGIEKMMVMVEKLLSNEPCASVFYTHLATAIKTLSCENQDAILQETAVIIADELYPAFKRTHDYLEQLLARVNTNHGVWALPNGDAYYAHALHRHTTTDLSAEEIHTLGLQEVARIEEEMRQLFIDEGMNDPEKSVGQMMQDLSKDARFYYPNTDEGRAKCLADFNCILERSRKELAHLFNLKPSAGVKIERVPEHEEAGAPAAYYMRPSADGVRPGIFFANLGDMADMPTFSMETLAIHEAEPGHHFQLALQDTMNIPILRKLGECNAYCEGWALYAEKLAYEHGFYSSTFSKLGHLRDEMWRAVRLVVDTGLHYKRWTREQAIDYMVSKTGTNYNGVVVEIDRYLVMPGQACSYKIGQLKILELRARAKEKLGERFDIRAFHDVVLGVGMVPLTVLEKVIDEYVADVLVTH